MLNLHSKDKPIVEKPLVQALQQPWVLGEALDAAAEVYNGVCLTSPRSIFSHSTFCSTC
jgi:hypothetical protein